MTSILYKLCNNKLKLKVFLSNPKNIFRQAKLRFSSEVPLKWSYVHGASDVPLLGQTIGQLMEDQTAKNPDKEAVVFCDTKTRLTYSQLLQQCDKLAAGLTSLGVKRGDRVGVWGNNRVEWIISQYATARAGIILVNINPRYIASDLAYSLERVGCKVLISAEQLFGTSYYGIIQEIIPDIGQTKGSIKSTRLPDLQHIIMMGDTSYPGTLKFDDVLNSGSPSQLNQIRDLQKSLQFDDPINIQFTSGTTGFPKAATLTHHNITNNCNFIGRNLGYHKQETRIAIPVPLYHCFGCVVGGLQTLVHGACSVYPSSDFNPKATLDAIQNERCTALYGVPTMFIDILNCPQLDATDVSSLYTGIMAASPCPLATMTDAINRLNLTKITVCYGSTETSPVSFQSYPTDPIEKRISTIGHVHPHVEAKIVDESGDVAPVNTLGQLWVRGYLNMIEYWNDTAKTMEAMTPARWYKSGDQAVMDEEGYVRIVGRIKDMIIRGGENVYPVELENVLIKHPKVLDVQVVGVEDSRLGEEICACVKIVDGETLTEEEIKSYFKEHLARYKQPRYVVFVKEFPLTATGKVQKYQLRKDMLKQLTLK